MWVVKASLSIHRGQDEEVNGWHWGNMRSQWQYFHVKCWGTAANLPSLFGHFPLIICSNQFLKKSFSNIYACNEQHMYKSLLTPTSFFAIYYFQSAKYDKAKYVSCRRHIPVPSSLLLPKKVWKHETDHRWQKVNSTVHMLQTENQGRELVSDFPRLSKEVSGKTGYWNPLSSASIWFLAHKGSAFLFLPQNILVTEAFVWMYILSLYSFKSYWPMLYLSHLYFQLLFSHF